MSHLVLLGDSIFDNGAYVRGGPALGDQVRQALPAGWRSTLLAVDGDTTADVLRQLQRLPADASHLALSVGGNDALMHFDVLDTPVSNSAEAFLLLADASDRFEAAYRRLVAALVATRLPLVVCTVYDGNFADAVLQRCARLAIAVFDDVILRVAAAHRLAAIDLRTLCNTPADYANDIEPSSAGGAKIAAALVAAATGAAP